VKYLRLIYLILILAINNANANIETCIDIANNFNKHAIAKMFDKKMDVVIDPSPDNFNKDRCFIYINIKPSDKGTYQGLGTAIIYNRQVDNYQLFLNAKKQFMKVNNILYWENILPFVNTGFVDGSDPNYQIFDAYLKNERYVIFTYTKEDPLNNGLSENFIKFINIVSQQIMKIENK